MLHPIAHDVQMRGLCDEFNIDLLDFFSKIFQCGLFLSKLPIGTTKAAIEANNGTYCLRK